MESKTWRQTWSTCWPRCQTSSSFSTAQSTLPSTFPSTPSIAMFKFLSLSLSLRICIRFQAAVVGMIGCPCARRRSQSSTQIWVLNSVQQMTTNIFNIFTLHGQDVRPKVAFEIRNHKNEHFYQYPLRYEIPSEMEVPLLLQEWAYMVFVVYMDFPY